LGGGYAREMKVCGLEEVVAEVALVFHKILEKRSGSECSAPDVIDASCFGREYPYRIQKMVKVRVKD
jgi:hypothetical protein